MRRQVRTTLGFALVIGLIATALAAPIAEAKSARPTFRAQATPAAQGGVMKVKAKVVDPSGKRWAANFAASAVVHLASGDVPLTLKKQGNSLVASGNVPVGAAEPTGPVTVEVTVTYKTTTVVLTVTTKVVSD